MPIAPNRRLKDWKKMSKSQLVEEGKIRVEQFCNKNSLPVPTLLEVDRESWLFAPICAYYRQDGIRIQKELCASLAGETTSRNWNWPASVTDREPFGVMAHELGHHVDRETGEKKGSYYSEICQLIMTTSGEKELTSYCPNPAEWFAEMFRLFVTNSELLKLLRPKTYALFRERWSPVSDKDWQRELGICPHRILDNLKRKVGNA